MIKVILVLGVVLISSFGFSQNKIGGNDPIKGIDIIIKKDPGSQPISNTENNPLIDQINKLESEYLNLKAKEAHNNFAKKDLSKLKTKDEVFKAYIAHLSAEIKNATIVNNNSTIELQSLRRRKAKQHIILPDPKVKN